MSVLPSRVSGWGFQSCGVSTASLGGWILHVTIPKKRLWSKLELLPNTLSGELLATDYAPDYQTTIPLVRQNIDKLNAASDVCSKLPSDPRSNSSANPSGAPLVACGGNRRFYHTDAPSPRRRCSFLLASCHASRHSRRHIRFRPRRARQTRRASIHPAWHVPSTRTGRPRRNGTSPQFLSWYPRPVKESSRPFMVKLTVAAESGTAFDQPTPGQITSVEPGRLGPQG